MGLYRSLAGTVHVKLTSADIPGSLLGISAMQIPILQAREDGELSVRFVIHRCDYVKLKAYTQKRGERLERCGSSGVFWTFHRLHCRPVVILGVFLLLFMMCWLPGRILLISVEGNERIPSNLILEAAENCGIRFGASRREVRSERVKNALLEQLEDLQWAGVNTYGCRGIITVRERKTEEVEAKKSSVSSIVAVRDGVITSVTVTSGTGLCTPGQAVTAGQTLISGYNDCGIVVRAACAEGEVMALTGREITAILPGRWKVRAESGEAEVKYSLLIGKKRINFYKGSGISDATCVKMYSKYVLTLPGGFILPVSLIEETVSDSVIIEKSIPDDAPKELSVFAQKYLTNQMIAGRIISATEDLKQDEQVFRLEGRYACCEMIGRVQAELIGEQHGKTDGTDRERGSGG